MAHKNDEYAHLYQELNWVKQDSAMIRNAVVLLEQEKDNLRQAVRKLKLENVRIKEKMKKMQGQIKNLGGGAAEESDEEAIDYDDIGKDFILVGGAQDPLAIRFEATIEDADHIQHKSAERYYWYKMAEKFNDNEAKEKILNAANTPKAEEAMKEIKGFDENIWNEVKMSVWEEGQRLKFEQVRWIANVLLETGTTYIAVSHHDKTFGTGWRKNREESNKPIFWDGQNKGGKFLMRYRKNLATTHTWSGPNEKEETTRKIADLKRYVWRRIDPAARRGGYMGGRGGSGRGGRGGYRGGGEAGPSGNRNSNYGSGDRGFNSYGNK